MSVVAYNDQGTTLMYENASHVWGELVGIVDVPDLGGAGNTIEVTELKSPVKQYISDRKDTGELDFTYNRTAENFEAVSALADGESHNFLVRMSDGTGTYVEGTCQTWKSGFSAGSAQQAILHIVPTTIEDKTAQEVTALIGTSV